MSDTSTRALLSLDKAEYSIPSVPRHIDAQKLRPYELDQVLLVSASTVRVSNFGGDAEKWARFFLAPRAKTRGVIAGFKIQCVSAVSAAMKWQIWGIFFPSCPTSESLQALGTVVMRCVHMISRACGVNIGMYVCEVEIMMKMSTDPYTLTIFAYIIRAERILEVRS